VKALRTSSDLLVIGSGIAGLFAALVAARDRDVVLVTKGSPEGSSSSWLAQGGIAAALAPDDSPALHTEDTLRAGRGLCRESAARVLAEEAPARVVDLVELGVEFDEGLALEGGHSRRRIAHAGGAQTGKRVAGRLLELARAHPRVELVPGVRALRLWENHGRCAGALTDRGAIAARATLLATGGMAGLWSRTTNPSAAVGDGVLLAYEAGAAVADLELVQFHPTALAGNGLLLSEALRGDGALLVDREGRRFVDELAPRDVVARAVAEQGSALLDLRPVDRTRYPALMARIAGQGFDPASAPVPVEPAAHYTMGGIATDLDGATELPGLYAAGECACTGVHGANRLASNSLLECLCFGRRAALAAREAPELAGSLPPPPDPAPLPEVTMELRRELWRHAGLVRDAAGLEQLRTSAHPLARLVADGALVRAESRGGHFRVDHPAEDPAFELHVVHRLGREPTLERWT
jgi:L-aspartate oxidase